MKKAKVSAKVVGRGGDHMGNPGKPASIKPAHFQNKPTGQTAHPAGKSNSKGARKFNHG